MAIVKNKKNGNTWVLEILQTLKILIIKNLQSRAEQ